MVTRIEDSRQRETICRNVLKSLPDWFGNPESLEEYAQACRGLPLWAAMEGERAQGCIAYKPTSPYAGEIHVMGVRPDCHRKGLGRALFQALYAYAKEAGCRFLTVKTVEMGRYPDYDLTNRFYQAMGFVELECFPNLWDEANPCQIYIMEVVK